MSKFSSLKNTVFSLVFLLTLTVASASAYYAIKKGLEDDHNSKCAEGKEPLDNQPCFELK
jgi:hypothetical protein